MGILGVGVFEIIVIMAIAVVVLGPERIPEVAVQMARAYKFLRNFATDSTRELRSEFEELMGEYEELREEMRGLRATVDKDVSSVNQDLEGTQSQLRATTRDVDKALAEAGPIIEPGGDLPPSPDGDDETETPKPTGPDGDR